MPSDRKIFISYAHVDAANFVKRLNTDLEASDLNTWVDFNMIDPGENFMVEIERGIDDAIAVIAVLTPGATISEWSQAEWNSAINLNIPLIPVIARNTDVPAVISTLQYIDFTVDYTEGLKQLKLRIKHLYRDHLEMLEYDLEKIEEIQRENTTSAHLYEAKADQKREAIQRWKNKFKANSSTDEIPFFTTRGDSMFENLFAGRSRELIILNGMLNNTLHGSGQSVLIKGEAGTGKTRLIEKFAENVQSEHEDVIFLYAKCNSISGSTDAYLPFRTILNQLTGNLNNRTEVLTPRNTKRVEGILKKTGRALVEVAPDLIGSLIPGGGILTSLVRMQAAERGMLEALEEKAESVQDESKTVDNAQISVQVLDLLQEVTQEQPLVLVLDDLHWCDEPSINLFFHLIRELTESKIMFVGAFRQSDIMVERDDKEHPFQKARLVLTGRGKTEEIDLDEANQLQGSDLFDAMLAEIPHQFSENFIRELKNRSSNHPLTVSQLLKMMAETDQIEQQDGVWIATDKLNWDEIPDRLESVFDYRLNLLTDQAKKILRIGSVEGIDFTAETIARFEKLDEIDVINKLSDDLMHRHQLVQETDTVRTGRQILSRFKFVHALLRDHIYDKLGDSQKRKFHYSVGEILEELYADDVDEIANQLRLHFQKAGDIERMINYTLIAAQNAFSLHAYTEAIGILQPLFDTEKDDVDRDKLMKANFYIGESYRRLGKTKVVDSYLEKALKLSKELNNKEMMLEILLLLSQTTDRNTYHLRNQYLDKAIQLAEELNDIASLARAYRAKGYGIRIYENVNKGLEYYFKAFNLIKNTEYYEEKIIILNSIGVICRILGKSRESIYYYNKSLNIARETNNYYHQRRVMANLGTRYREIGDMQAAKQMYYEALDLGKKLGRRISVANTHAIIGYTELLEGRIKEAEKHFQIAIKVSEELVDRKKPYTQPYRMASYYYLEINSVHKAKEILGKIFDRLTPKRNEKNYITMAEIEFKLGNTDKSLEYTRHAINSAEEKLQINPIHFGYNRDYARCLLIKSWILQDDNLSNEAKNAYEKAFSIVAELGNLKAELLLLNRLRQWDDNNVIAPVRKFIEHKISNKNRE